MLDDKDPLKFSYHVKEMKIISNSNPSCEKLKTRLFPISNPLLDKSKKKWSTFGPIQFKSQSKDACVSSKTNNSEYNKKKRSSTKVNIIHYILDNGKKINIFIKMIVKIYIYKDKNKN